MPGGDVSSGAEGRLQALGLELPAAPILLGNYVEVSPVGSLLFISGTLPIAQGQLVFTGRLGDEISVVQGREAARFAAIMPWPRCARTWGI